MKIKNYEAEHKIFNIVHPIFPISKSKILPQFFRIDKLKTKIPLRISNNFFVFFSLSLSFQQESNLLTKSIAWMVSKSSLAICCHANCEWLSTRNVHVEWNMSHGFSKEKARVNCFSSVIHRINYLLSLWQTERKKLSICCQIIAIDLFPLVNRPAETNKTLNTLRDNLYK